IRGARERVRRAMLATLLLAQGTPMLNAGDEIANSQGGNNNAYCQDNATGWLDWAAADRALAAFVGQLLRLRREHALLRHARWFVPAPGGQGDASIAWFTPGGAEMQVQDWHDGGSAAFACQLRSPDGRTPCLQLLFNPEARSLPFSLAQGPWALLLDSSGELAPQSPLPLLPPLIVPARSLLLLCAL
ncbi:MAG TPA: glycogen debranching enzyme GlgX, partial [Roseateles sp.]|nr:glycogen debranching enzyme GlgX [Roseateles sp.]